MELTFHDWLQVGIGKGWVSDVVCETHDGVATTDEEAEEFDKGYDPCIPVIRVWPDNIVVHRRWRSTSSSGETPNRATRAGPG